MNSSHRPARGSSVVYHLPREADYSKHCLAAARPTFVEGGRRPNNAVEEESVDGIAWAWSVRADEEIQVVRMFDLTTARS
jgi:hypothetical protein